MAMLTVTTQDGTHHEMEVREGFALDPSNFAREQRWFIFNGENGAQMSFHEGSILAIHVTKIG